MCFQVSLPWTVTCPGFESFAEKKKQILKGTAAQMWWRACLCLVGFCLWKGFPMWNDGQWAVARLSWPTSTVATCRTVLRVCCPEAQRNRWTSCQTMRKNIEWVFSQARESSDKKIWIKNCLVVLHCIFIKEASEVSPDVLQTCRSLFIWPWSQRCCRTFVKPFMENILFPPTLSGF